MCSGNCKGDLAFPAKQRELWANSHVIMQIVPKGRKWTSAFTACGGGYLTSNHICLLGLTHFKQLRPDLPHLPVKDWETALNIRFQRGKDSVSNILACDRHGTLQLPANPVKTFQKQPHQDEVERCSQGH